MNDDDASLAVRGRRDLQDAVRVFEFHEGLTRCATPCFNFPSKGHKQVYYGCAMKMRFEQRQPTRQRETKHPITEQRHGEDPSQRQREEVEGFIRASVQEILEHHAERVNEGTKGMIFRLRLKDLSPDALQMLDDAGMEWEGEQAMKVLKVYQPGRGRKEFEMQKKAYDIVEGTGRSDMANVPRPMLYQDVRMAKSTLEALHRMGMDQVEDRVEVLLMDYIPGKDLATMLYQEVVKRHPALHHMAKDAERMDFSELSSAVSLALGFSRPGGKSTDPAERAYEKNLVFQKNAERLYAFLDKVDFVMDGTVLDQIERTMDAFHQNGLCFRDGHHRNFMVDPSGGLEGGPQAYIVDFGDATSFEGTHRADLYREESGNEIRTYLDDLYVVKDLRRFTKTRDQRRQDERQKYRERLDRLAARLQNNGPWRHYENLLFQEVDAGQFDMDRAFARCPASPDRLENFLVGLTDVLRRSPELHEEVRVKLIALGQRLTPFEQGKIRMFLGSQ